MKRYTQPKAGTSDKTAKQDIENSKVHPRTRMANLLESLQYIYKGDIKNEWQ